MNRSTNNNLISTSSLYQNKKRNYNEMISSSTYLSIPEAQTKKMKFSSNKIKHESPKIRKNNTQATTGCSRDHNKTRIISRSLTTRKLKQNVENRNLNKTLKNQKSIVKSRGHTKDDKLIKNSEFKLEEESDDDEEEDTFNVIENEKKKKKVVKSSEELILEDMTKYKFSAQPIKKNLFKSKSPHHLEGESNKINAENQHMKKIDFGISKANNFNQILKNTSINFNNKNENIKESKEDNLVNFTQQNNNINNNNINNIINKENVLPLVSNPFLNNKTTTEEILPVTPYTGSNININNIQSRTNPISVKSNLPVITFKAKTLPNFTYKEVKKSETKLTIPKSPELRTKSRSLKKTIR